MNKLPIYEVLDDLKTGFIKSNRVILQAPPGAGKSTVVPLEFLNDTRLNNKKIIVLEPRQIAAKSIANRLSNTLNEKVGQTVGYRVKMDSCVSKDTIIEVVTEAILIRMLQDDQSIENIGMVIFDEFHERSINIDLALALCLEVQELLRDDLKLLIMSATLDSNQLQSLLGDVPVITSRGKSFDVDIEYLSNNILINKENSIHNVIYKTILNSIQMKEGDILVFLAGVRDILIIQKLLEASEVTHRIEIVPLHSKVSNSEQNKIYRQFDNKTKIILSTNIAQTSLTIDGIKVVIDSGLEKTTQFNSSNQINKLVTQYISSQTAIQRAGRAGRTSSGKCYRIWHKKRLLEESSKPQVLRSDISSLVLEVLHWGVKDLRELKFLDYPKEKTVENIKSSLKDIQFLDDDYLISDLGSKGLSLGVDTKLSFMIIQSNKLGYGYEACVIAVILEELSESNFSNFKDIYEKYSKNPQVITRVNYYFSKLKKIDKIYTSKEPFCEKMISIILLYAYLDRLAIKSETKTNEYKLSNGKRVIIDKQNELSNKNFLVITNLIITQNLSLIGTAIEIAKKDIENYFDFFIQKKQEVSFNKKENKIYVKEITYFKYLQLNVTNLPISSINLQKHILRVIEQEGLSILPWSGKVNSLRQRVAFINYHDDKIGLANFDDQYLIENLDQWLGPYLVQVNSMNDLNNLDLFNILKSQISWEDQQLLEELAPQSFQAPSGTKIKIDYSDFKRPKISVKIQELFGLSNTPLIFKQKVPLLFHLLTPALRPIQITDDLESFWKNSYSEVVKELKGKYKKHYWPDDPISATATTKTKKQMVKHG